MDNPEAHAVPYSESRRRLGRAINAARRARAMSLARLAQGAGVSRNAVQLIESGTHSPRVETLQRIADALGVPACSLLKSEAA